MKNENKKLNTNPFYKTANNLLRIKVEKVEDVKKFYIGINKLAAQISLNASFINEFGSEKYNDNPKLLKGIIHILGYGQEVKKSKLFETSPIVKEVNLDAFLEKNPQMKRKIKSIQIKAKVYFSTLKQRVDAQDEEIKKIKEELREIKEIKTSSPEVKEISIGPLKHDGARVFYDGKPLKLTPQMIRLCGVFMKKSQDKDRMATDEELMNEAEALKHISFKNTQKLISKLRQTLQQENKYLCIKRVSNSGYTFEAGNIR